MMTFSRWLRSIEPKLPTMTQEMRRDIAARARSRGLNVYDSSVAWYWLEKTGPHVTTWTLVLWMPIESTNFTEEMAARYGITSFVEVQHPEPVVQVDAPWYVYGNCNNGVDQAWTDGRWMFRSEAIQAIDEYAAQAKALLK